MTDALLRNKQESHSIAFRKVSDKSQMHLLLEYENQMHQIGSILVQTNETKDKLRKKTKKACEITSFSHKKEVYQKKLTTLNAANMKVKKTNRYIEHKIQVNIDETCQLQNKGQKRTVLGRAISLINSIFQHQRSLLAILINNQSSFLQALSIHRRMRRLILQVIYLP